MSALSATHASYSHVAIDTLAYAKKLKAAGVPEIQAEIHAEALAENIDTHLATKQDIKDLRNELKQDIKELKQELKQDIKELKQEIKEIKRDTKEMEKRLAYQLTVRMGGMFVTAITILPILIKLLHFT